MTYNAQLAGETLSHLVALGVESFVVCAGARNAPIVTSLLAVEAEKELQVFHHFDERSAAFFALGLAKSSGVPAAVLTTSGTAVAELHGAVIEAFYAGIPLIAVTADRPPSFRGSGAPQAIEQAGIFGPCAPIALDVQQLVDLSGVVAWNQREPLHINVCLEEPTCQCRVDVLPEINLPKRMLDQSEDDDLGIEAFVAPRSGLVVILGELPPKLARWNRGIPASAASSDLGRGDERSSLEQKISGLPPVDRKGPRQAVDPQGFANWRSAESSVLARFGESSGTRGDVGHDSSVLGAGSCFSQSRHFGVSPFCGVGSCGRGNSDAFSDRSGFRLGKTPGVGSLCRARAIEMDPDRRMRVSRQQPSDS